MKIKRRDFILCVITWFFEIAVLLLYSYRTGYYGSIDAGIINALFSAITLTVVLRCIRECSDLNIHSGAEFLLLICAVYNYNSITKFTVDELYPGFITNTLGRLLGNIYVDVVIILVAILWKRMHKRNFCGLQIEFDTIHVSSVAVYTVVLIYLSAQYLCIRQLNLDLYNFSLTQSVAMSALLMCFVYTVYALVFLYAVEAKPGFLLFRYIPIIVVCIINLFLSLMTGKRNFLMVFIFIEACNFIASGKISQKIIEIGCVLSAPVLQLFTTLSFNTSGRIDYFSAYKLVQYQGIRYDLSDLAITIAHNYLKGTNRLGVIGAAILEAMPKDLFPNIKKVGELVYFQNLASMGLPPTDYNDTIFSMGAQIMGYVGIFLILLLFVIYYEWLSKRILRMRKIGISLFILIMNYYIMVENSWNKFVSATRDMLILLILGAVVMSIIVKRKETTNR